MVAHTLIAVMRMKRWVLFVVALLISGYGIYCDRHPRIPTLTVSTKEAPFFYTMRVDADQRVYGYEQSGVLSGGTVEQVWTILKALIQEPDPVINMLPEEVLLDEGEVCLRFPQPFLVKEDVRHWEALVANLISLSDVQRVRAVINDQPCKIPVTYTADAIVPSSIEVFSRDLYQAMTLTVVRLETIGDKRRPVLYSIRIPQTTQEEKIVNELTRAVSSLLRVKTMQEEEKRLLVDVEGDIADANQKTDQELLLCLGRSLAANLPYEAIVIRADGISGITVYRNDMWQQSGTSRKKD